MVQRLVICLAAFGLLLTAAPARALYTPADCEGYVYGQGEPSEECLATMRDFPAPLVGQVTLDSTTLATYSYWRVGPAATPLYDAPNGSVVGEIGAGFNFVNAIDTSVDGWIQIQDGHWVSRQQASYYEPSQFTGVTILDGLRYPFAWVLGDMVTSAYPGGAQQNVDDGRILYRYQLVNLFSRFTTPDGWDWYLVGENEWVEQRNLSIATRRAVPDGIGGRWLAIDVYEQNLIAYENDTPVFATLVATGLPGTDTNMGTFRIWAMLDRDTMSGFAGAPRAYALQSVPWVMYFDDAISLHGTYWHDGFGFRRSRGCVNLSISDARHLFNWVESAPAGDDGQPLVTVYVWQSREFGQGGTGAQTK